MDCLLHNSLQANIQNTFFVWNASKQYLQKIDNSFQEI